MYAINHEQLPVTGLELINKLNQAGFEAWFVGGCVRDLLMGATPHDWDICTNALPEQTAEVLKDYRIHATGIKHGTVLVMSGGDGYEITTFRTETAYTDHRHPDEVKFVRDLASDLARRDFTINAMAYHSKFGLVDLYGGRADLESKVIRAVGEPKDRFREDALRILRALRFAGRLDFTIEAKTAQAIHACREDLNYIAAERIFSELKGFIVSEGAPRLLMEFREVIGVILPEVIPLFDYDQNNPHHDSDCWHHTARVVAATPNEDIVLRLSALLHDLGKPDTCTVDEKGISHFYGHNKRSKELSHQALVRLKCDNETRLAVEELVGIHDLTLPQTMPETRRFLAKTSPETALRLLVLRRADVLGQSTYMREEKLGQLDAFERLLGEAVAENACWTLDKLAIKGSDLIARGMPPGPEVGKALKGALNAVIDGIVPNDREKLLDYVLRA